MRRGIVAAFITAMIFMLSACGDGNDGALHIEHTGEDVYGTGDYLYNTVYFSGSKLEEDTVLSVKEMEEMICENEAISYEGKYSMLTRGSIFSIHDISGIKLYDLLVYLGLDEKANDDTDVRLISADGYMTVLTLGEIRASDDNTYESMENEEPMEENVPVVLAFGSDGVPLVGSVGSMKPGDTLTEKDGFVEDAENVGGPVRLIAGQKSSVEFNAPDNAKWIRKVIVGEETTRDEHEEADKECLEISVLSEDGRESDKKAVSYGDIENHNNKVANYYGKDHFFSGVQLWSFINSQVNIPSDRGNIHLYYTNGKEETVDIEYFRNLKGDYSEYITEKDGLAITNVTPALGYSVDGKATESGIYALLPAFEGYVKNSQAKKLKKIVVEPEGFINGENEGLADKTLTVKGKGVRNEKVYTYGELQSKVELAVSEGDETEISLGVLLEETGMTCDAGRVTVIGEDSVEKYTYKNAINNKDKITINLNDGVSEIIVDVKKGLWTHSKSPYEKLQKSKLKISGSEAKKEKFYTLKELENKEEWTVRDSFGASGGINGYQGIILRELIEDNLKSGIEKPSKITIIGKDGYETELFVDDVMNGVDSKYQEGMHRDVILAYSIDGNPLVENEKSEGFKKENGYGPIRLIVENQISKWVKNVKEVRIGE